MEDVRVKRCVSCVCGLTLLGAFGRSVCLDEGGGVLERGEERGKDVDNENNSGDNDNPT